jgi:hypothetical protein
MKKFIFILLVFSGIGLISNFCNVSGSEPVDNNTDDVLLPLKVGNYWTYARLELDSTGNIIDTVETFTDRVLAEKKLGNETWYYYGLLGRTDTSEAILYKNREDGLYICSRGAGDIIDSPHLFLKYPTAINDTFTSKYHFMKTLSLNENISTKIGDFPCIKYYGNRYPDEKFDFGYELMYFTPGIGQIEYFREFHSWNYSDSTKRYSDYFKVVLVDYHLE